MSDAELEEVLVMVCEFRQRLRDQLNLISPGEYERVTLAAKIEPSGKKIAPFLRDVQREQKVMLPEAPAIGEVVGSAVGGDHGCILRFEMQATKGSGRIVPLGSIQKIMWESIEAAAQYVKAEHGELGITAEWHESFDVAILGTSLACQRKVPQLALHLSPEMLKSAAIVQWHSSPCSRASRGAQRPSDDR